VDSLTTTSSTLYSASRGYDAVGAVISENTALGASSNTDNQLFCYDFAPHITSASLHPHHRALTHDANTIIPAIRP
jgi:hypothetical protein